MMNNAKTIWLAWSALVIALVIFFTSIAWIAGQKYRGDESKLAEVGPRFARLLGIKGAAVELDKSIEEAKSLVDTHVYPAGQEVSLVGNTAQQKVREAFSAAGMDVVSTQILPAKPAKGFEKIGINLRVEGSLLSFQTAMTALSAVTPTVWVEGFSIQVNGTPNSSSPQRLNISLNLYVLRNL